MIKIFEGAPVTARSDHDVEGSPLVCWLCFTDPGLRLMASRFKAQVGSCPNCGAHEVALLTRAELMWLAQAFFVRGSITRTAFGGAPTIQFNEANGGSLAPNPQLGADLDLLQRTLGVGFFHYGPRLWMVGEIEPLDALQDSSRRSAVIRRIINEYPRIELTPEVEFYRARKAPADPSDPAEYDAPPEIYAGTGRLDSPGKPVLYGSQDLEVCVHESRFIAGDELFAATLRPLRPLRVLDLTTVLVEDVTEFESLDLAVLMLFLAESHSYDISRAIAAGAADAGFDGLAYPSYFSLLRTGAMPFESAYGLSLRRLPSTAEYERSKIIANLALFGRPIESGLVEVAGINRLVISRVAYDVILGPVTY